MSYVALAGVILIFVIIILIVMKCSTVSTTQPPEVENYSIESSNPNPNINAIITASNNSKFIGMVNLEKKTIRFISSENYHSFSDANDTVDLFAEDELQTISCVDEMLNLSNYRVPLENGYPVHVGDVCLFSDHILEKDHYPLSEDIIILPPIVKTNLSSQSKIPKIIHQTFESLVVPKPLAQCAQQWRNLNPDYTWKYWTSRDRRQLIKDNFDPCVLQAYDDLYPGAFKADLWRCCAVYLEGGVYADIKLFPLVPLSEIIDTDVVMTLDFRTYGIVERYIYNAFFAFPPRHPLLKIIIDRIVKNVESRWLPIGPGRILDITGPGAWRDAVRIYTHKDQDEGITFFPNGDRVKLLGHSFNFGQPCTIINPQTQHIILAQPPHHLPSVNYWKITGKKRYDKSKIYV